MNDADRLEYLKEIRYSLQDPEKTTPADPLIDQRVKDSEQDRGLKKKYAHWFIGILIVQLFIMNLVFICVGFGWLNFSSWSLNLYTGGTLAEVFGIVLVITKNLFPAYKYSLRN